MAAKKRDEEAVESSRAAGGCVLAVLAGGATGAVFAASPTVGVLGVWGIGAAALWWSVRRRVSDMPATPPPTSAPPLGDVYAGGEDRIARVEYDPSGARCTIHVVRQEVNEA